MEFFSHAYWFASSPFVDKHIYLAIVVPNDIVSRVFFIYLLIYFCSVVQNIADSKPKVRYLVAVDDSKNILEETIIEQAAMKIQKFWKVHLEKERFSYKISSFKKSREIVDNFI